jgi:hypothetical protein
MMSELGLNDNHDSYTDGSSSNNAARYTAAGAGVAAAAASAGGAYDGNSSSSSNTNYQFAAVRGGSSSNNTNCSNWAPSVLHELTLSTSEGPNSNESVEMAQYVSVYLMFNTKCTPSSSVLRSMFQARAGVLLATCYDDMFKYMLINQCIYHHSLTVCVSNSALSGGTEAMLILLQLHHNTMLHLILSHRYGEHDHIRTSYHKYTTYIYATLPLLLMQSAAQT